MFWLSLVCWVSQIWATSPSMVASEMEKCNLNLAFYFICKRRDWQWGSVLTQEQEQTVKPIGITRLSGSGAEQVLSFWDSFYQWSHSAATEVGSVFPLCQAGAEVLRDCSLKRMTGKECTWCGENLWSEQHPGWWTCTGNRGVGLRFLFGLPTSKSHRSVQGPKQTFGSQLPNSYPPLPTQLFHWLKPKATWLLRRVNTVLFWPLCWERLQKGSTYFMINYFTLNICSFSWTFRKRPWPDPELLDQGELGWGPSVGWVSSVLLKSGVDDIVLRELLL